MHSVYTIYASSYKFTEKRNWFVLSENKSLVVSNELSHLNKSLGVQRKCIAMGQKESLRDNWNAFLLTVVVV